MARINIRKEIVIERNPVERFLIRVNDLVRANKRIAFWGIISFFALTVILIASLVWASIVIDSQKAQFETLTEKIEKYKYENDMPNAKKTVDELKAFSEETWFGFTSRMGLYYAGNYYYEFGDYEKSLAALEKFVSGSKKNIFWELSLLKIGIIHQELKQLDKALESFKRLESDNKEGLVLDQLFYYMGSLYNLKNDKTNSRKYYNRVVNEYSQSPYAAKAKKRLFLLGMEK